MPPVNHPSFFVAKRGQLGHPRKRCFEWENHRTKWGFSSKPCWTAGAPDCRRLATYAHRIDVNREPWIWQFLFTSKHAWNYVHRPKHAMAYRHWSIAVWLYSPEMIHGCKLCLAFKDERHIPIRSIRYRQVIHQFSSVQNPPAVPLNPGWATITIVHQSEISSFRYGSLNHHSPIDILVCAFHLVIYILYIWNVSTYIQVCWTGRTPISSMLRGFSMK